MGGGGRVVDAHADSECAAPQTLLDLIVDLLQLPSGGLAVGCVPHGQKSTRVIHDFHPHGDVSDRHAEVD